MPRSRAGEVVVITGGAGGIGQACGERWVADGGMVVACDVNETLGRAFEAKHPGRVLFVKCDTRRREDLEAAAAAAAAMGRLTCWYNNAGVGAEGDVLDGDGRVALDSWTSLARVIDININATALGTYIALSSFDAAHGGVVITTASMAGLLPIGAPPVYSMSKAANIHFNRAVASAYGDDSNIRVYTLCPSYTATAMGPPLETIKAALGGVLTANQMADGFMMLANGDLPNGSVMRVTARARGTKVVHDLVVYGKEHGGDAAARPGVMLKSGPLGQFTDADLAATTRADFLDVSKLSKL